MRESRKYRLSKRVSRQMRTNTVGTHVTSPYQRIPNSSQVSNSALETTTKRRGIIGKIILVLLLVLALSVALFVGITVSKNSVSSSLSIDDQNLIKALSPGKITEPSYILIEAELGFIAEPLDNKAPDSFILAHLDPTIKRITLIALPPELQVTHNGTTTTLSSLAATSNADMVKSLSSALNISISYFATCQSEKDVKGIVDVCGGIPVEVNKLIDDPHAGYTVIPAGNQTLDTFSSLVFLRADNVENGSRGKMSNQLQFLSGVISHLFKQNVNYVSLLEKLSSFMKTNLTTQDFESIASWSAGVQPQDIMRTILPGDYSSKTSTSSQKNAKFIMNQEKTHMLFDDIKNHRDLSLDLVHSVDLVDPQSFVVEVQNGTTTTGAAAKLADILRQKEFKVGPVGNAEQQIYEETLVIYKSSDPEGLNKAKTVIDAIGVGRAVESSIYYTFEDDVLIIIGADNRPTS